MTVVFLPTINKETGKVKDTLEKLLIKEIKYYQQATREDLSFASGIMLQGLYLLKLQRWMQIFPQEQFLILKSEDFFGDPAKIMKQVFQFLELPEVVNEKYHQLNIGSYPAVQDETRQKLTEFFHLHNQELEEYLQMDFNW